MNERRIAYFRDAFAEASRSMALAASGVMPDEEGLRAIIQKHTCQHGRVATETCWRCGEN